MKTALKGTFNRLAAHPSPASPRHRRQHRTGVPSKLDIDPELRAFVVARLDTMTYPELAEAVAAHFPPDRRVGKTAINEWNRRRSLPR